MKKLDIVQKFIIINTAGFGIYYYNYTQYIKDKKFYII